MAVQTFATKRRTACYKQARYESLRAQDEHTERVISEAVKASKRARSILRDAERFLAS